jgi:4,5-dihydroxyphthalate decarboxylase
VRRGEIRSPRLNFAFADVKTANHAFKQVVRELKFDVAELAIITYLTARAHGKPLVLLPVVVVGRFWHGALLCSAERPLTPADLAGRRIGIRAHSVTTVAWVRGILQNDYGVDLDSIRWMTFEDAHVAEVLDPPGYERAPAGKIAMEMLVAGELDAVVLTGSAMKDPRVRPVIPDPPSAERAWYERHGLVPINHMVVVTESLAKSSPWALEEIVRLLAESKKAAGLPADKGPDALPFGVEAVRKSLEMIIRYAYQQKLIPRPYEVDELFTDLTRNLGR